MRAFKDRITRRILEIRLGFRTETIISSERRLDERRELAQQGSSSGKLGIMR